MGLFTLLSLSMAVLLVIEPIFEADFEDCSYGFRPGRNAHEALAAVREGLKTGLWIWKVFGSVISFRSGQIANLRPS